jgi:hypothetical protein
MHLAAVTIPASGGQKMSFPTIQYHFHTVLMYVRIFSISYCIILSKNTVVQNREFGKIQLYRTNYCEIVLHVESGSSPIKIIHPVSTHAMAPLRMRPHHDSCHWIVNIHMTPMEEEIPKSTIKHEYSLC